MSAEKTTQRKSIFDDLDVIPGFLSGSSLKLIAVVTMTIDHFAAGVIYAMLVMHALPGDMTFDELYRIYQILRGIGRTAFPIYCFLLVEGLLYTRSRIRYLRNLILFALLSELPFDLALPENLSDMMSTDIPAVLYESRFYLMEHQNVFCTLAIGLAACWAIDAIRQRLGMRFVTAFSAVLIGITACLFANLLHTDYHAVGVLMILAFYILHPLRIGAAALGYTALTTGLVMEEWSFPGFFAMLFYNGKRGFLGRSAAAKYFFYIYYPAHLMLFFFLRVAVLNRFF